MKKSLFDKIVVVILLLILVITNMSYAASLTKEDLKKSIKNIYSNKISIETTQMSETGEKLGTSSMSYEAPDEVTVDDSKIIIKSKDEGKEQIFQINYSLEENKCTFDLEIDPKSLGIEETENEAEKAMYSFVFAAFQNQVMNTAYITVADALGLNLDVAGSYYSQVSLPNQNSEGFQMSAINTNFECNEFKYTSEYNEQNYKSKGHLEVNIDELSKINESSLNGKVKSVVTIGEISSNSGNTTSTNTVNKITTITPITNTVNNTANRVSTNKVNNVFTPVNKLDNTTVINTMPQTGDGFLAYVILGLIAVSLMMYIRIRKLDSDK